MRGSIRQLKDPKTGQLKPNVWELRVPQGRDPNSTPDKPRYRTSSKLFHGGKRAAERELARLVGETTERRQTGGNQTLGRLLDDWIAHLEAMGDHSPLTVRGYKAKIRHMPDWLKATRLSDLGPDQLNRYYRECREGVYSETGHKDTSATVRHRHRVLSSALHYAERAGYVAQAPTRRVSLGKQRSSDFEVPKIEEVKALYEAARQSQHPQMAEALMLLASTGMRRGELCGLTWQDVDFERSRLLVRRSVWQWAGETGVKGTKSGEPREIALDPDTLAMMRAHRDRVDAIAAECEVKIRPDSYVFSRDPAGRTYLQPDVVSHFVGTLAKKLKIHVTPHGLRHFSVTQLIAAGVDVRTVAGRHGHADSSVTLRVYAGWLPEKDREAAAILGRRLFS